MNILVFAESESNTFKKSSFEALSYGKEMAKKFDGMCIAVCHQTQDNFEGLGKYGADKVVNYASDDLVIFNPKSYAEMIVHAAKKHNCQHIVISQTYSGKAIAPLIAVLMEYNIVTGIVDLVEEKGEQLEATKTVFSNKAYARLSFPKNRMVITLVPNSCDLKEYDGKTEIIQNSTSFENQSQTKSLDRIKAKGKIPLTEAEIVVSAGRGLKGPENWNMIEELADLLGGATACSKPVSDMEWRPHSEHVGQTGITIKPDLYIAIGISGAIQHLAGVGSSKNIVVINTDKEAPFFKAADYGIVGDAFDVVPKMIAELKNIQS